MSFFVDQPYLGTNPANLRANPAETLPNMPEDDCDISDCVEKATRRSISLLASLMDHYIMHYDVIGHRVVFRTEAKKGDISLT